MHTKKPQESARQIGAGTGVRLHSREQHSATKGDAANYRALAGLPNQTHVWAENYDREVSDLLPLEREVQAGIAEQVQLKLLPSVAASQRAGGRSNERPVDPESHHLYLRAAIHFNKRSRDGLQKSVDCFERRWPGSEYAAP